MSVQKPTHPGLGNNVCRDLPLFKLHEVCSVDFRKIVIIVATRCHILSLKRTKNLFRLGLCYPITIRAKTNLCIERVHVEHQMQFRPVFLPHDPHEYVADSALLFS